MDGALKTCSHVWLRKDVHVKPLTPLYNGLYMVLSRTEKTFTLQVGTRMQVVSVDRLKPVHAEDDVVVAQLPRRGRLLLEPPAEPVKQKRGQPKKVKVVPNVMPMKKKHGRPRKKAAN